MPDLLSDALNAGLRAHRAGQIEQALATYDAVLAIEPNHGTARHLRGFALLQLGSLEKAALDLRAAVRLTPSNANAWGHLAVCLSRMDESAISTARRALLLNPASAEPLDVICRAPEAGPKSVSQLLQISPGEPTVWSRAGVNLARSDPDAARRALQRCLMLAPGEAPSLLDLADLERQRKAPATAHRLASWSLILRPMEPRSLAERAAASVELDAIDDALAETAMALVRDPAHVRAWGNRGEAFYRLADYEAAKDCGKRALMLAGNDPDVRANLGAYRLAAGDLSAGWRLFRNRPARRQIRRADLPRWTGESGVRLLVLAEQGLGDELLFSSMWSDLDRRIADGGLASVKVEADRRIIALGSRACPHLTWHPRLSPEASGEHLTHWCLAGDLMEMLRPTLSDFGGSRSGLAPDPGLVDKWVNWMDQNAGGRPAVGLCWRSGSLAGHRQRHYPAIEDCAPILLQKDRFFVVLQYDECEREVSGAPLGQGSEVAFPPGLDRRNDQEGVAALMAALDLVVSADTAVLALAGALGVPALGFVLHPGWVGLGQPGHPWFPSVERLYRPPTIPWKQTMTSVAERVDALLNPRPV